MDYTGLIENTVLIEATVGDLKRKQKSITKLFPDFFSNPDKVPGIARRGGLRMTSMDKDKWTFRIHSGSKDDEWYEAVVKFKNVVPQIQYLVRDRRFWNRSKTKVDLKKLADKFMQKVDVELNCDCPADLYWGSHYIRSQDKYRAKYGDQENRPPDIRNPRQYGAYCKHLQNLMRVLSWYKGTMANWLKRNYSNVIKQEEDKALKRAGRYKAIGAELGKRRTKEAKEEDWKKIIPRSCMAFVEGKSKELLDQGISNFKVVLGYVYFKKNKDIKAEHVWIELEDGTKIDDTFEQFARWDESGHDLRNVHYLPGNRIELSPKKYISLCKKFPNYDELRDFLFGKMKESTINEESTSRKLKNYYKNILNTKLKLSTWGEGEGKWFKFLILKDGDYVPVYFSHGDTTNKAGVQYSSLLDAGVLSGHINPEYEKFVIYRIMNLTENQIETIVNLFYRYSCKRLLVYHWWIGDKDSEISDVVIKSPEHLRYLLVYGEDKKAQRGTSLAAQYHESIKMKEKANLNE